MTASTDCAEVVAILESSTLARQTTAAQVLGITRQGVALRLLRGGYVYTALERERVLVRAEAGEVQKAWRREERLAPCGTKAAYARHRQHGEKACVPCLDANADAGRLYQTQARDRDRPNRRRDTPETAARKSFGALRRSRGNAA
jgi:hypothetical protein